MKRSRSFVEKRRDEIATLVERRGKISVNELAETFGVSPLTIRRDLAWLEEQSIVRRSYGMVTLVNPMGRPSGSKRIRANKAIAQVAAQFVEDGDSIFINTSSTAMGIIDYIEAKDVTVITNNSKAPRLPDRPNITVLLTGGEIREGRSSLTGALAVSCIERVSATKCFIGCSGLTPERGLTAATSPEPPVNALMIQQSEQHFVLADSSKLTYSAGFQFGTPDDVDVLITDDSATDAQVSALEDAGVGRIIRAHATTPQAGD